MTDRFFLDTNVLVYAFDSREPVKAKTAGQLVRGALQGRKGVISYQVVQEFFNVMHKRFDRPLTAHDAEMYLDSVLRRLLSVYASVELCRGGVARAGAIPAELV